MEGEYQPIEPMNGRIPSQELGLHLERDGTKLRLFDPVTGRRLLTSAERAEEEKRLREEAAKLAEVAEAALDAEKLRAHALRQKL